MWVLSFYGSQLFCFSCLFLGCSLFYFVAYIFSSNNWSNTLFQFEFVFLNQKMWKFELYLKIFILLYIPYLQYQKWKKINFDGRIKMKTWRTSYYDFFKNLAHISIFFGSDVSVWLISIFYNLKIWIFRVIQIAKSLILNSNVYLCILELILVLPKEKDKSFVPPRIS